MPDETMSLHDDLRAATHLAHERLDDSFGSIDIARRDGFTRFLCAHSIGMAPLFADYSDFVARELEMDVPDYPVMLARDLADLGVDAGALPSVASEASEPAGIAYVLAGSRLGLSALARGGYWGGENDSARSYMEDPRGLEIWRSLVRWMRAQPGTADGRLGLGASANAAFATFGNAFVASASREAGPLHG